MWTPISLDKLYDKIFDAEKSMTGDINNFWNLIKIDPEKWKENEFGNEGGGFWVVAICGKQVIWYNDIEEGFNISIYGKYGTIAEYWCNQDHLQASIQHLFDIIKFGGQGQASHRSI